MLENAARPSIIDVLCAWLFRIGSAALCLAHVSLIWSAADGRDGIFSEWPIAHDDHPLYFHSTIVTREFLKQNGTTAGYDPSFMAGYPKSVVFPSSSTLPELAVYFFGGERPEDAYNAYVFVASAVVPWLMLWAAAVWGASPSGGFFTVLGYLIYIWTDFPINYAALGMTPYFVAIPLGLVATGLISRFLEKGGLTRWLLAGLSASIAVTAHFTTAMVVAPAAALTYLVASFPAAPWSKGFRLFRHLGTWLIPAIVLGLNVYWWLPGVYLASTKGPSGFAFAHPEGFWRRLAQIPTDEAPVESLLIAGAGLGVLVAFRRSPVMGLGLASFGFAGFFWGYWAAEYRELDFLQPGRHTYAFFSASALAFGLGLSEAGGRLRSKKLGRMDVAAFFGVMLVGYRLFAPMFVLSVSPRVETKFLSGRPPARLLWVVERIKKHVAPGERLLYEEGGFGIPGLADPYQGGRYSGLLPKTTGVELLGGPYLHASLETNFTQFGEGKLFGKERWDRAHFVKYAEIYRPSAILCWTPWARSFCRSNPDLVETREDDGVLLLGIVKGYGGATIRGSAKVTAKPNVLEVSEAVGGVDGIAVLRYHSVPLLRSRPPEAWEPVLIDGDPVPFIGVRASKGPIVLDWGPGSGTP